MPSTMSVTCSRRADESVSSPRINANSIATADTSVNAQTWWRKANSVDMARIPRGSVFADCRRGGSGFKVQQHSIRGRYAGELSCPAKAGHPVRRGFSVLSQTSLEYWAPGQAGRRRLRELYGPSASLRAKRSNPSLPREERMDCFVASLLAMTLSRHALSPPAAQCARVVGDETARALDLIWEHFP